MHRAVQRQSFAGSRRGSYTIYNTRAGTCCYNIIYTNIGIHNMYIGTGIRREYYVYSKDHTILYSAESGIQHLNTPRVVYTYV